MTDLTDWISALGGLSGFVALGFTGIAEWRRRQELAREPLFIETSQFDLTHLELTIRYRCKDLSEGLTLQVEHLDSGGLVWVAPDWQFMAASIYNTTPPRAVQGSGQRLLVSHMLSQGQTPPSFEAGFVVSGGPKVRLRLTVRSSASGVKRAVATIHASPPE
jgi:hypothetical protein